MQTQLQLVTIVLLVLALAPNITDSGMAYTQVARGTTAQRTSSPVTGMLRYNTTVDVLEQYSSSDGWY